MGLNYTYVATAVSTATNEVYTNVASFVDKDYALNMLKKCGYAQSLYFRGSAMVIDLHTGEIIGKIEF